MSVRSTARSSPSLAKRRGNGTPGTLDRRPCQARERNLQAALGLAKHFGTAYARANNQTRRHLNQAIFEAIYVDVDGISSTRLAQPFNELLADDLLNRLDEEMKHPVPLPARGVKENHLVEVMGRYSNPNIAARIERVLSGRGRDRVSDRPVRSVAQKQTKLFGTQRSELVRRYKAGESANDSHSGSASTARLSQST